MRTTLNIEDDVLLVIKQYADERAISLGQAASDLIHRGVESLPQFKMKNGWVIFDIPVAKTELTNETLHSWEAEDLEQEYLCAVSPGR